MLEVIYRGIRLFTFNHGPYDSAIAYARKVKPIEAGEINIIPLEKKTESEPFEATLASAHFRTFMGCVAGAACFTVMSAKHPELITPAFSLLKVALVDLSFIGITKSLKEPLEKHKEKIWYRTLFHFGLE